MPIRVTLKDGGLTVVAHTEGSAGQSASDGATRSKAYGDRKQSLVIELTEAGEVTAYPDALRLIVAVNDARTRVAAASSSKNAGLFLRQIRLDTFAEENGLRVRSR